MPQLKQTRAAKKRPQLKHISYYCKIVNLLHLWASSLTVMPAARQYKPVFLISSRSKIPGMEIAAVAVGALFELTTELLCCFVCFRINSPVNLQSNLDVMGREMNSLMDRSKEVIDEKEVAEKEGNEIRSQVLKWLDDVEKL